MSILRVIFLGLMIVALLILALANMQPVTLHLLPSALAGFMGTGSLTLPLFIVILASVAIGLLIGFTWEWVREHKHRSEAARQRAERERLERQLAKERGPTEQDDVLALVERNT